MYKMEWRKRNLKRCREYMREWREKNRERLNMIEREKIRNDPKFRLNHSMSRSIWKALKQNKAGRKWETLVGYTLKDLIRHLETLMDEKMSWQNYGSYFVIDHIRPRSSFNFKTADDSEFKKCWALENLQPLEAIANIKKSNKY